MDVFPTIAGAINRRLPTDTVLDGRDLTPLLSGKTQVSSHDFLFHYFGSRINAVRYRPRTGAYIQCSFHYQYLSNNENCTHVTLSSQKDAAIYFIWQRDLLDSLQPFCNGLFAFFFFLSTLWFLVQVCSVNLLVFYVVLYAREKPTATHRWLGDLNSHVRNTVHNFIFVWLLMLASYQ